LKLTKDLTSTSKETLIEEWYRLFYDRTGAANEVTEFAGKTEPAEAAVAKSSEVLAKEKELAKVLPKKQQVPVSINSKLEGNTVRVRYDPMENGGIGNIRIEAGSEAKAADIAAHGRTVKYMQQYQGLSLHVQKLKDQPCLICSLF
jgi:hypothetical protein